MTEYGRGQGSEPWHPGDPYYGDGGWEGQYPQGQQHAHGQQDPYGGQPQHDPYGQQHQQQYGDGYGQQHQQQYGDGQQHQQYGGEQQQYGDGQQQYGGDWGTGQQYGQPQHDPYAQQHQQAQQQPQAQQHQQSQAHQQHQQQYDDGYGQSGYPQQQGSGHDQGPGEWDAEPQEEEHPFFTGRDDEDDDEAPRDRRQAREGRGRGGRSERRGRGGDRDDREEGRRGRGGCLIALLVVGSLVVGGGYYLYQERFAAAPDYSGDGNGQAVSITIPPGSSGAQVGQILKAKGVVKSVDGFVAALTENGGDLQAGAYQLEKEMSAESAVEWLLDPKKSGAKGVVVTEGMRNVAVYKAVDKKLKLKAGTTRKIAEEKYDTLGLPEWADDDKDIKDPLEGFLFPATYPASEDTKPEDLLKEMVSKAVETYEKQDLEAAAEKLDLESPMDVVTVASLVQAEGKTHDDFRKMAEVVYNRLAPDNTETNNYLQFDSTFNYAMGQSQIQISERDIQTNRDPYNTYTNKFLPPGPIGNPGQEALDAALKPTSDGWIYFVATDGMNNTEFAKNHDDFLVLKEKFNESQKR
ncbi:endolytic transglycosylase MltG [Streptomyces fragilis]|uniref:Endolytic murein transglycosylase n=1 Tax=Streptomyces fragilis TaxID=67301 RepID=A0ABV2YE75_9ACTN|nr:endolytic transglycosylase MltG [Streptomyces fragilis]